MIQANKQVYTFSQHGGMCNGEHVYTTVAIFKEPKADKQEKPQIGNYPIVRFLESTGKTPSNPQAPHRVKDLTDEIVKEFCKLFKRKNHDNNQS